MWYYAHMYVIYASNVYKSLCKLLYVCISVSTYNYIPIAQYIYGIMHVYIYLYIHKYICYWKVIKITLRWCHTLKKATVIWSWKFDLKNHANIGMFFEPCCRQAWLICLNFISKSMLPLAVWVVFSWWIHHDRTLLSSRF